MTIVDGTRLAVEQVGFVIKWDAKNGDFHFAGRPDTQEGFRVQDDIGTLRTASTLAKDLSFRYQDGSRISRKSSC